MKILFSPSETKFKGGCKKSIDRNSFLFPELFDKRMEALNEYQKYLDNSNDEQLAKLFGTSKQNVINYYKGNLLNKEIIKVIERYDGVAFDYLKYSELEENEKSYIDKNGMSPKQ